MPASVPDGLETLVLMRFGGLVSTLALVLAAGEGTQAQTLEASGTVSLQTRWYPRTPVFADQESHASGFAAEPSFYAETASGTSFTVSPFVRYDSADSRRTHADFREAYMLTYGDWGENFWELRLGVGRVFWGVAELHNLVDIVNQFDLIEDVVIGCGEDWALPSVLPLVIGRIRD